MTSTFRSLLENSNPTIDNLWISLENEYVKTSNLSYYKDEFLVLTDAIEEFDDPNFANRIRRLFYFNKWPHVVSAGVPKYEFRWYNPQYHSNALPYTLPNDSIWYHLFRSSKRFFHPDDTIDQDHVYIIFLSLRIAMEEYAKLL